jgi:hypothetical protein
LRHGDLDRLAPEHRKSLSAFSFGPPGNFLLPPTQANRVLSCLVYPTNLSGLVDKVTISGPSLVFLIDMHVFSSDTGPARPIVFPQIRSQIYQKALAGSR